MTIALTRIQWRRAGGVANWNQFEAVQPAESSEAAEADTLEWNQKLIDSTRFLRHVRRRAGWNLQGSNRTQCRRTLTNTSCFHCSREVLLAAGGSVASLTDAVEAAEGVHTVCVFSTWSFFFFFMIVFISYTLIQILVDDGHWSVCHRQYIHKSIKLLPLSLNVHDFTYRHKFLQANENLVDTLGTAAPPGTDGPLKNTTHTRR